TSTPRSASSPRRSSSPLRLPRQRELRFPSQPIPSSIGRSSPPGGRWRSGPPWAPPSPSRPWPPGSRSRRARPNPISRGSRRDREATPRSTTGGGRAASPMPSTPVGRGVRSSGRGRRRVLSGPCIFSSRRVVRRAANVDEATHRRYAASFLLRLHMERGWLGRREGCGGAIRQMGNEPTIGIDLGTTNSVVATVMDGSPVAIPSRTGQRLTPSVLAFSANGKRLVGAIAKRQAIINPSRTIFGAKRLIGRRFGSDFVKKAQEYLPYELVRGGINEDVRVQIDGENLSIPEISGAVLRELRLDAEAYLGVPVRKAVITVPAYFTDSQRQATRDAGSVAGLEGLRVINEPTAAALAYGVGRALRGGKVVVFDLGGGTFDISVLDMMEGVYEVTATSGDTSLGGDDLDRRIVDWMVESFVAEHGVDPRGDKMAMQRLRDAAEKAKCEL